MCDRALLDMMGKQSKWLYFAVFFLKHRNFEDSSLWSAHNVVALERNTLGYRFSREEHVKLILLGSPLHTYWIVAHWAIWLKDVDLNYIQWQYTFL